jgi:hypothetical protein
MKKDILTRLESNDIHDVYFANGKLFFLNEWDEDSIRRLIKDIAPEFKQANICLDTPELFS